MKYIVVTDWTHSFDILEVEGEISKNKLKTKLGDFNLYFVFPIEYKEEVLAIIKERQRLKRAFDDSMQLVYQLINKVEKGQKMQ